MTIKFSHGPWLWIAGELALNAGLARAAEAPPTWVNEQRGVVRRDGERVLFGVGAASGDAGDETARELAANQARSQVSKIIIDSAAPKPKQSTSKMDDLFDDMHHTEVKIAVDRAAVGGVDVAAVWQTPDGKSSYALAAAPVRNVLEALDSLPLDSEAKANLQANIESQLNKIEAETKTAAKDIPRFLPQDFRSQAGTVPQWVRYGCGKYTKGKDTIWFGVGIASGLKNPTLARATSESRARAEIAKCVSFTIQKSTSGIAISSNMTLWGVSISDHWLDDAGNTYALAEVPDQMLPGQDEKQALLGLMRTPPSADTTIKASASMPLPPSAPHVCSSKLRGDGLRIGVAIIGAEADTVRGVIVEELKARKFRLLANDDFTTAAHGQLGLVVRGDYSSDKQQLRQCQIEVEFLRGAETLNNGRYGCVLSQDPKQALDVGVSALLEYANVIKCGIADNLFLAAQELAKAEAKKPTRRSARH